MKVVACSGLLILYVGRHGAMIEARAVKDRERTWKNLSISLFIYKKEEGNDR